MNAQGLLEHFDRLIDTPDAVPRLRRFILDLAVRGKLVEQDPKDNPAGELLKSIQIEKARLTKTGENRRHVPLRAVEDGEVPFHLPRTWSWGRLGDVFNYDAGAKTEPRQLPEDAWLLELEDIEKDSGKVLQRLSAGERSPKSTKSRFQSGDVLYGKLRPYLNKAVVADGPGFSTTEIVAVRCYGDSVPRYTCLALRRPDFVDYVTRLGQGTKMPRLRTEDALAAPFPLPPLAEQHRIVAKVDELMALCDELEAAQTKREKRRDRLVAATLHGLNNTEATPTPGAPSAFEESARFYFNHLPRLTTRPDHIHQLRQTILNLAVRGKLVPQDPNDESAEELYERIQAERTQQLAAGVCLSNKPLPPIEEGEKPFPLPNKWEWFRLRSLVSTLGDGLHGTPEYSQGTGCHFINGNNLIDGRIVIKPHTKTVSMAETKKHRKLMTLNTVLISINGTLGNVAFYNNEDVVLGKSACYFNLYSLIDKYFVRRVMESSYFVDYAMENATGTTIRNLGLKAMNYFPVPLPPLAEQRRVVAALDELMALCDEIEAGLRNTASTTSRLLEANLLEALPA